MKLNEIAREVSKYRFNNLHNTKLCATPVPPTGYDATTGAKWQTTLIGSVVSGAKSKLHVAN